MAEGKFWKLGSSLLRIHGTYTLIPRCRRFYEKSTATHSVKQQHASFMEPRGSLPCSQKPTTNPILSQPNPVHPIDPYLLTVHLNVILPLMLRSSQWSLPFGVPNQNPVNMSSLPHTCHTSH